MATTWDPSFKDAKITLSGGNLIATLTTTGYTIDRIVRATTGHTTGKWYFEVLLNDVVYNYTYDYTNFLYLVATSATLGDFYPYIRLQMGCGNGDYTSEVEDSSSYNAGWWSGNFTDGVVTQVAVDLDAHKVWFGRNNVWGVNADGNPATGVNPDYTALGVDTWYPAISIGWDVGSYMTGRFATANFSYAPPSGFSEWDGEEGAISLPAGFYAHTHKMLTTGVDWNSATLRMAWVSSGYTFSDAHTALADLGANIVATSELITPTATNTELGLGEINFLLPNATGSYGVLYAVGSYEGVTNPLLIYLDSVSATVQNTNLKITFSSFISI